MFQGTYNKYTNYINILWVWIIIKYLYDNFKSELWKYISTDMVLLIKFLVIREENLLIRYIDKFQILCIDIYIDFILYDFIMPKSLLYIFLNLFSIYFLHWIILSFYHIYYFVSIIDLIFIILQKSEWHFRVRLILFIKRAC